MNEDRAWPHLCSEQHFRDERTVSRFVHNLRAH